MAYTKNMAFGADWKHRTISFIYQSHVTEGRTTTIYSLNRRNQQCKRNHQHEQTIETVCMAHNTPNIFVMTTIDRIVILVWHVRVSVVSRSFSVSTRLYGISANSFGSFCFSAVREQTCHNRAYWNLCKWDACVYYFVFRGPGWLCRSVSHTIQPIFQCTAYNIFARATFYGWFFFFAVHVVSFVHSADANVPHRMHGTPSTISKYDICWNYLI